MDSATFDRMVAEARARQDRLLKAKGADYTRHSPDRLANFKRTAAEVGVSPLIVWAIYFNKHIDAIMAYVKSGKAESESIESRFDDAQNYLYLGEALLKEAAEEKGATAVAD